MLNFYVTAYAISKGSDQIKHSHSLFGLIKYNMELNDLRKIICFRKFEVFVEKKKSVCKALEKLVAHGIHCLPCYYTNDIIYLLQ